MWYLWTKVNRANIPAEVRVSFEQYGEAVVAQVLGRPYTHSVGTVGVPEWAGTTTGRLHGLAWLREKHNKEERTHDVTMTMEMAIIILVAAETVATIAPWIWPDLK